MRLRPPPPQPDPVAKLEELLARPQYSGIPVTIVPHAQAVPLGVMVRRAMEWLLDEEVLNALLREKAPEQYTRALTISTMVKLLIQVSAGVRSSVYAAYKADQEAEHPSVT